MEIISRFIKESCLASADKVPEVILQELLELIGRSVYDYS